MKRLNRKKWVTSVFDKDLASQLAQEFNMSPYAALLAVSRGLTSAETLNAFFGGGAQPFADAFSLPDMDKAVTRLNEAIENGEHIVVFGDYDADGVTATALMVSYLETRGAVVSYQIPDRLTEGYGLSTDAVRAIKADGAEVVVTVDNGVSALDEAALMAQLGMELIVTDHHKPPENLPQAYAVVDPHRKDCVCEYTDYAGVGVAFKLICALEGAEPEEMLEEFGDLAAIGTIGDIVPLHGENRLFAKMGIEAMNTNPRTGVRALLEVAGIKDKAVTASSVAFALAPRINAAGRIGCAKRALELLLTDDEQLAQTLAQEIEQANRERKSVEDRILDEADKLITADPKRRYSKILVVDGAGWHSGVIGIVASRLTEKYGRPCIILARDGNSARGSGRSIAGFSLYDALESVSHLLTHFGGHTLAAGLEIECEKIDAFITALAEYTAAMDMPFPIQRIDFRLNPAAITPELVKSLSVFEPYGAENSQPVFGLYGLRIDTVQPVSEGKHTKITASKNGTRIRAIMFGANTQQFPYVAGDKVDLAVTLEVNEFRGEVSTNIHIRNIRLADLDEDALLTGLRCFEAVMRDDRALTPQSCVKPDRELFAALYRLLKTDGAGPENYEVLCRKLGDNGSGITAVMIAVKALEELGVVVRDQRGFLSINGEAQKVNLEDAPILQRIEMD